MSRDLDDISFHVESTLKEILQQNPGAYSASVVLETIKDFVLADSVPAGDAHRYAELYYRTGKAAIIARAWLLNMASDIKQAEDTAESIQTYLKKTYGQASVS